MLRDSLRVLWWWRWQWEVRGSWIVVVEVVVVVREVMEQLLSLVVALAIGMEMVEWWVSGDTFLVQVMVELEGLKLEHSDTCPLSLCREITPRSDKLRSQVKILVNMQTVIPD